MISVFCRGLTSEARQIITETFGFAQVSADKLRIIDLDYYDLDVTKHNFIFCIGQTIKDVCKDLVKHQYYSSSDLLQLMRSDIVDDSNGGFLLYSAYVPPEFWRTGTREDQVTVWNKISSFVENYKKMYVEEIPFNDRLPPMTGQPEPVQTVEEAISRLDEQLVVQEEVIVVPEPVKKVEVLIEPEVIEEVKQMATQKTIGYNLDQVITIDVADYIHQLSELINLTDIGNSKSLTSYGHMVFHTSTSDLNVFSTVSELNKSKAEHKILLKDLIGLLKAASVFNSGKVTFHKGEIAV